MALQLHTIKPNAGARKERKTVGRGLGSKGTYSGRGAKGQRARSGGRAGLKLKGLRKLMLSMPKARGFSSLSEKAEVVNVGTLARSFAPQSLIHPKALLEKGLIPTVASGVKILGTGAIGIALMIEGCRVSAEAKKKIEAAGGSIKE